MSLGRLTCKVLRPPLTGQEKSLIFKFCHRSTNSSSITENEYSESASYPPILELDKVNIYKRDRDAKLDKIKRIGTVEEKIIGINMPRFYGWSSLILKEKNLPFNYLPFVQFITRTDFLEVTNFPFVNELLQSEKSDLINKIRPQLQDAILLEMIKRRYTYEYDGSYDSMEDLELQDLLVQGIVEQINRVLSANLIGHAPHLMDTEIDYEPRIEAFWRVGGFYPDRETYKERKKDKENHKRELKTYPHAKRKIPEEPEDLVGHFIQYLGSPALQLRHLRPLRPLEPRAEPAVEGKDTPAVREPSLTTIPYHRYDPGFYGLEKKRRHGTNIPGFWPGDPNEFGLVSFHSCAHLLARPPSFGPLDLRHTVTAQAVLAGYSWILAQANYQGFNTFNDLTYPLTTTTVVTDGQMFSFFASQVNTLLMHDEFIDTNPKVNVCYGLPALKLFDKVENDQFVGWNDEVVSLLVDTYLNAPAEREDVDLKPYLDQNVPLVQDIAHAERRGWLHRHFRYMCSNRPRHHPDPEIFDWERIYKVMFNTRPLDKKVKFFDVDIDPFKRRLDQHRPEYIPRKFRDPDNYKKKYKDTFYPDA